MEQEATAVEARAGVPFDQARRSDVLSAFVVLALIALLLTPFTVQREVHRLRDEIEHAADPARTMVTGIQYLIARQTSVLRGYLITRDEQYLERFRELHAREQAIYDGLAPLADRLGSRVLSHFVELRTLSREWHDRLDEEEIAALGTGPVFPAVDDLFEQSLYLQALESAAGLDEAVAAATQDRRQEIGRAERRGLIVNGVLALLAAAAALVVVRLNRRVRGLAREAESRRALVEEALHEKARAIEARAHLLRGVTHDVQNPLGAADAYAELLELGIQGPLHPPQLDFIARIRRSIRSAMEIIRDLLDLAGAETGGLKVELVPADVTALAHEIIEEHRGAIARAGHSLVERYRDDLPTGTTDPARVRQILGNLLSNAIKYTPRPGRIEVTTGAEEQDWTGRPGAWLTVQVADSGPGIPREDREAVFAEFVRLDAADVIGYGLGLPISRRLAQLLGGEITVGDAPGRGAAFTLWLPQDGPPALGSAAEAAEAPAPRAGDLRPLAASDARR